MIITADIDNNEAKDYPPFEFPTNKNFEVSGFSLKIVKKKIEEYDKGIGNKLNADMSLPTKVKVQMLIMRLRRYLDIGGKTLQHHNEISSYIWSNAIENTW